MPCMILSGCRYLPDIREVQLKGKEAYRAKGSWPGGAARCCSSFYSHWQLRRETALRAVLRRHGLRATAMLAAPLRFHACQDRSRCRRCSPVYPRASRCRRSSSSAPTEDFTRRSATRAPNPSSKSGSGAVEMQHGSRDCFGSPGTTTARDRVSEEREARVVSAV